MLVITAAIFWSGGIYVLMHPDKIHLFMFVILSMEFVVAVYAAWAAQKTDDFFALYITWLISLLFWPVMLFDWELRDGMKMLCKFDWRCDDVEI